MNPLIMLALMASRKEVPNGSTVTPVDDYTIWLECAELPDTYGSLAAVIANSTAKTTLCNNLNALRYMVRSTSTIMPAVLASGAWITALDASTYAVKTPTMTSATAPSGEVIASGNNTTFYPYLAFDKNNSTLWVSNAGSGKYIGYKFTKNIYVYKLTTYTGTSGAELKNATLQHSANGSSWSDVQAFTDLATGSAGTKTKVLSSVLSDAYWRLMNCTRYDGDVTNAVQLAELDFYGLDLT